MSSEPFIALAAAAALVLLIADRAFADGVYVGKSETTQQAISPDSFGRCPTESDIKITIAGQTVTYQNVDRGGPVSGTLQGNQFSIEGTTGNGIYAVELSITGVVDGDTVQGTRTSQTRGGTCSGTFRATRQAGG